MRKFRWQIKSRTLELGERTLMMGVLNVTPDSFSDGGEFQKLDAAVVRALELERSGADILDIGGESTRPGAAPISDDEELARVMPALSALRGQLRIPISIDTRRAVVAEAAIDAGAEIVNDISALRFDARMAGVVRSAGAGLVLMHMRGAPGTMQKGPFARNVVSDVSRGLRQAVERAKRARIPRANIVLDPGIGFGKNYAQNFEIIGKLNRFAEIGCPLLVGPSRKAFLGAAVGSPQNPAPLSERIWATAAVVTAAIMNGAHIVRVHDVAEMLQVARIADRLRASL